MNNINILVLDRYEQVIKWLHPDKTEVVETNKQKTQRSIQITYPLEHDITGDESQWFEQGNKIFIPKTLGIDSCLYVINTQYSIDYWEKNVVTVSAEEVLTELNYSMFEYTEKTALKINKENLEKWFGDFYQIDTIDTLNSSKNTINPFGTMTRMSLLRLIEETTEYIFKTSYTYKNVTITRHLSLLKPENMRTNDPKHPEYYYINLSHNMESLELDVDESSTYTAMAPVLSLQTGTTNTTGTVTTTATTTTSDVNNAGTSGTSADDIQKALKNWKALKVDYRESIPMIVTQDSDGKITYGAKWYAPFIKEKDSLYIYTPAYSNTSYNEVIPMNSKPNNGVIYPLQKIGTVQTSEKDPYAIYNTLANSLLSKNKPKFTLKVSVKDVQTIVGGDNSLGYQLYDTIYVKVPGFDYYVKCTITETKKNPHLPGENTITVTSEVTSTHLQENTIILANDIKVDKTNYVPLQGNLLTVDNVPLGNALMNMSVTLEKTYTVSTSQSSQDDSNKSNQSSPQAVQNFDPVNNPVTFVDTEIQNMAKQVKNYIIEHNANPKSINMRATNGKIYRIPFDWCRAIYYGRNMIYIYSEGINTSRFGKGAFASSLTVKSMKNLSDTKLYLWKSDVKTKKTYVDSTYLCAYFYYMIQRQRQYIYNRWFKNSESTKIITNDPVTSGDVQNNSDCGPTSFSNMTELFWNYISESQMMKKMGFTNITKPDTGSINYEDAIPKLKKLGYKAFMVEATWENFKKYNTLNSTTLLGVDCSYLSYYQRFSNSKPGAGDWHSILVHTWFETKKGDKIAYCEDSNFPVFGIPFILGRKDYWNNKKTVLCEDMYPYLYLTWKELYKSLMYAKVTYCPRKFSNWREVQKWIIVPKNSNYYDKNGIKYQYIFMVVQLQSSQRSYDAIPRDVTSDSKWNPWGLTYYISSTEIERAYGVLYEDLQKNYWTKNNFSMTEKIKDVNGKEYNVSGKWLTAMMWAYIYNYRADYSHNKSAMTITVNKNSNAMWYYNVFDTTREWISMTYFSENMSRDSRKYSGGVYTNILCTQSLIFRVSGTFLTINQIKTLYTKAKFVIDDVLMSCVPKSSFSWFGVDFTIDNVRKYMNVDGVIIFTTITITGDLRKTYSNILSSTTNYDEWGTGLTSTILLTDLNDKNHVTVYTGMGNGNSPTHKPNTTYTSNNPENPFIKCSISDLKNKNNSLSKTDSFYNNLLIVSPWDKKTTDQIAKGNIPKTPYKAN